MLQELFSPYRIIDSSKTPPQLRLAAYDIDNTLTHRNFHSWSVFTEEVFADEEAHDKKSRNLDHHPVEDLGKIFGLFSTNQITLSEAVSRWLALWNTHQPLTKSRVEELTNKVVSRAIPAEIREIFYNLQYLSEVNGIHTALISASYKEFVRAIANELQVETYRHNPTFKYNRSGIVTDMKYNPREAQRKINQMRYLARKHKISLAEAILVDDKPKGLTRNLSVATLHTEKYPENTWAVLRDFTALPQALMEMGLLPQERVGQSPHQVYNNVHVYGGISSVG